MEKALPPLTPGTLYLVATPIGNVEDMTFRALRTLKECDVVAAEDTRRTGLLLKHFDISRPLLSYFQFNEAKRSEEILERLRHGEKGALVAALTASGLPTDEFHFIGFLPHKSGQRRKKLEALKAVPGTLVLYESPYRVEKLLAELTEILPDREIVLARELTKKFEEFLRGTPAEMLAITQKRALKGEFVVLISEAKPKASASESAAS